MSARLLLDDFDGTLGRLELRPECCGTRAFFHVQYWDKAEKPVEAVLTFSDVIAVSFSVNYFDNPIGGELFGLYEIENEAEKAELLRENFRSRRREFLLAGYDGYDPEDPHDILNYTGEMERFIKLTEGYHLYQQQTQGGTYRLLAGGFKVEEVRHGPVGPGTGTVG